jgi:7,8-dihydropterin-6-yl-methyl-4-(beta-D-ribofuranosyl)aminobenzene 5'-phosphate synthase
MGGMHLINADPERIEKTIATFREYGLQQIGPVHCTGGNAVERIRDAFPKQYFDCSAGVQIRF